MRYFQTEIRRALKEIMETDPKAIMIGEDIEDPYGGCFKTTLNFSTWFPERVINTPISEAAIVGVGTGLALRGYHPIVEIMFYDFTALAFDQILNHLCKFNKIWGVNPKVLIRTAIGNSTYGVVHSQDLTYIFEKILPVYKPTLNDDIYEMLMSIFKSEGPKIFVEDSKLYRERLI